MSLAPASSSPSPIPSAASPSSSPAASYALQIPKCSATVDAGRRHSKAVALIACGSFSPPTFMHLRLFEQTRDWIRTNKPDWHVVGGFLSPVNDAYKKKHLAPGAHRLEMCRLAVQDSEWLNVDDWEVTRSDWCRTLVVLRHFKAQLNSAFRHRLGEVTPMLLCGADLLHSFDTPGVWSKEDMAEILSNDFGVLVLERSTHDLPRMIRHSPALSPHVNNIHLIKQTILNDISSTSIRETLWQGHSVKYLLPDSVIRYIQENGLFPRPADFKPAKL